MKLFDSPLPAEPVDLVANAIVQVFHVSRRRLFAPERTGDITWPRQIGMAALMDQFGMAAQAAAREFGRSDHNTARCAAKAVAKRSATDKGARELRKFLEALGKLRAEQGNQTENV